MFARLLSRMFDRWSRSSAFTAGELRILRALLPESHPDADLLYAQAAKAPYVVRKPVGREGYEARIPYVVDSSCTVECDEDIPSPAVSVVTDAGRRLQLSTAILRGGFLVGLNGVAGDGQPWPRDWNAEFQQCTIPEEVGRWLPARMPESERADIIRRLARWAGLPTGRPANEVEDALRVAASAGADDVARCERRLARRLGDQYRELLAITDGFGIRLGRPYEILGTRDLDYLDESQWIGVTPLYEGGFVVVAVVDGTVTDRCFLLATDGGRQEIGDLKEHVRQSLAWEVGPS